MAHQWNRANVSAAHFQVLLATAGGRAPVDATIQMAASAITSGTYTVPSQRSMVVLCWSAQTNPATAPSSCTISGYAATQVVTTGAYINGSTIFAVMVDPGDPNTWSVSQGNIIGGNRCRVQIYTTAATRINVTASASSTATAPTATLDVADAGSSYIGVANAAQDGSTSWTLLTENDDANTTLHIWSSACRNYAAPATSQTATATFTATIGSGGAFAVFAP
jgi:hypothetical protein